MNSSDCDKPTTHISEHSTPHIELDKQQLSIEISVNIDVQAHIRLLLEVLQ